MGNYVEKDDGSDFEEGPMRKSSQKKRTFKKE
jgi:hypothetical protein